jgi:hypothetical protein
MLLAYPQRRAGQRRAMNPLVLSMVGAEQALPVSQPRCKRRQLDDEPNTYATSSSKVSTTRS